MERTNRRTVWFIRSWRTVKSNIVFVTILIFSGVKERKKFVISVLFYVSTYINLQFFLFIFNILLCWPFERPFNNFFKNTIKVCRNLHYCLNLMPDLQYATIFNNYKYLGTLHVFKTISVQIHDTYLKII